MHNLPPYTFFIYNQEHDSYHSSSPLSFTKHPHRPTPHNPSLDTMDSDCIELFEESGTGGYKLASGSLRTAVRKGLRLQAGVGDAGLCYEMGGNWSNAAYNTLMPELPVLPEGSRHCVVSTRNFTTFDNPLHASLFASERIVAELCLPSICTTTQVVNAVATFLPGDSTLAAYCDASSDSSVVGHPAFWGIFALFLFMLGFAIVGSCVAQGPLSWCTEKLTRRPAGEQTKFAKARTTFMIGLVKVLHCWDIRRNFYRLLSGRRGGGKHGVGNESSPRRSSNAYYKNGSAQAGKKRVEDEGYRQENAAWVDGLKFFTLLWALLGQATFFLIHTALISNPHSLLVSLKELYSLPISSSYYAADLFLFFSGMLSTKSLFYDAEVHPGKYEGWRNICKSLSRRWLKRFARFLPMLAIVLLAAWVVVPSVLGSRGGSQRYRHVPLVIDSCETQWYKTLLMFDNWVYSDPTTIVEGSKNFSSASVPDEPVNCLFWSWFLAVDLQWSFMAPLLALPYVLNPPHRTSYEAPMLKKVMPIVSLLMLLVVVIASVVTNSVQGVRTTTGVFDIKFVHTINRGTSYCMGITCQIILNCIRFSSPPWAALTDTNDDDTNSTLFFAPSLGAITGMSDEIQNINGGYGTSVIVSGEAEQKRVVSSRVTGCCTLVGICLALECVVLNWYFMGENSRSEGFFEQNGVSVAERLYGVNYLLCWPLALLLGSVSLTFGRRGVLHSFLDSTFFTPLSRLSLGVCLLFPLAIVTSLSSTTTFYISLSSFASLYLSGICGALLPSFILYFIVEAPFSNMVSLAVTP